MDTQPCCRPTRALYLPGAHISCEEGEKGGPVRRSDAFGLEGHEETCSAALLVPCSLSACPGPVRTMCSSRDPPNREVHTQVHSQSPIRRSPLRTATGGEKETSTIRHHGTEQACFAADAL
eukprot:350612-Chlamydomonas_euryale.AAC.1